MPSKQYAIYMAVLVPVFVGIALAVKSLSIPSDLSFFIGAIFGGIAARAALWFLEWRDAERAVSEVSPDA